MRWKLKHYNHLKCLKYMTKIIEIEEMLSY